MTIRLFILVPFALSVASCSESPPEREEAASSAPIEPVSGSPTDESFEFGAYTGTLTAVDDVCVVVLAPSDGNAALELRSALRPPCFVLRSTNSTTGTETQNGGTWLGASGEARIWRSTDAEPVDVLIFNGDPAENIDADTADRYREHNCGERTQALILRGNDISLSSRVSAIRTCRDGTDEIEYWLYSQDE